ncbi:helix-hairpin-helix domain-containing protein [Mucilaginibacter sp. P25]|uniref:helix-hairpin-helix domain-containing protein n=1 Tax=unclassified Mucilaginibacter TaxID=2617802 RepID=UPI003D672B7E
MENKPIARTLRLLSQLMELHEVNPFKIKSVANAAFKVDKLPSLSPVKNWMNWKRLMALAKVLPAKLLSCLKPAP